MAKYGHNTVDVRVEPVRVSWLTGLLGRVVRLLVAGVTWLALKPHRAASATIAIAVVVVTSKYGPLVVVGAVVVTTIGLTVWRMRWPVSFRRQITGRLLASWRSVSLYRAWWQPAMLTSGLLVTRGGEEFVPKLVDVTSSGPVDRVRVRMLPGQTLTDYATQAEGLAQTFGATSCRVRSIATDLHCLDLLFTRRDALADPVTPDRLTTRPAQVGVVRIAVTEDQTDYDLRLLGSHVLLAGATGAGKSSALWAIICALTPDVRAGLIQVWAIDPKGGMELAAGRHLFTRFAYGLPDDDDPVFEAGYARMLEDLVQIMRYRQDRLRGIARLHTPTVDEPFIVLVVDEIAALTAYVTDRDAKRRISAALSLLLSQGRAVGVTVVAAVQDPRKETLPIRDLFPTRIALRLVEADQVGLVLGPGARERGADCHRIPTTLPGIGYVQLDGTPEPVRVRFVHHSDHDIATLMHEPDLTVETVKVEESLT